MRRGRLVLGGAGLVFALLLACVWLVPGMLDWNRYRDGIAALASAQLGRPVHIGGAVSLQLLPQPILTASEVAVDGDADGPGDGIGLRAKALRLRVALGPLLAGNVDARELTLQGADLRLPWPPPPGALTQRPPAWLTGLQARIEDGRLQVGDLALARIDAAVTTDPDTGTLSIAGTGQTGVRNWQFTARLARPGRDGSAGLDVSLDGQGPLRDTGGTFSGQLGADGALSGRVAGRGPDLSLLMPAPALPWRGDGRLSASGGLAVADELALEIGGAPARGAVALRVMPAARLDLAIAAGRLDLDAWLPALLGRSQGTLRAGIPTGIDLSAEAATLAGGTLRRLRGAVDLTPGAIALRDVTAILPGEAQFTLSGQMDTQAQPKFDGAVRLRAPDLRGTLRWLQRVLPPAFAAIPPGVLRTADLSAHVAAEPGQAAITGLHGALDGSQIGGSASVRLGARLNVAAALTLDKLALDPWAPNPAALLTAESLQSAVAALRTVDSDLKLQVQQAAWDAVPLGPVALELQSEAARVVLRRLDTQPMGARLSLAGQLGEGGRLTDGRLDATTTDLTALRPLFASLRPEGGQPAPWEALLRGPGAATIQAAGPPDALTGRVTLELADLRMEAKPAVNLAARRWAGPVTLHHPGAPRLLETLGLGGTVAWLGDGSMSLVGQLAATPGKLELEGATLAAGALRATGRVTVEGRRISGQIAAETLPLPLLYPRSPEPLPVAWLRNWQAALRLEAAQVLLGLTPVLQGAAADLVLEGGVLRLNKLAGRVDGGPLTGVATLDAAAEPPRVSVQAQLQGLGVPVPLFDSTPDLVAGQMEVTLDLAAAGYSPAALLATLSGRAALRVRDGVAAGFDLQAAAAALAIPDARDAAAAARAALLTGNSAFATLDAPLAIDRGVVTIDARLAAPSGEGQMTGSLDMRAGALDLRLTLRPATQGAPPLGLRVTGQAGALTRTPELADLTRWLADRTPQ